MGGARRVGSPRESAGWGVWGQAGFVAQPSVCFRPQARHPSPFKNKNKYLCCMLCVLGFSFLLEAKNRSISASLRGSLPAPAPRPVLCKAGPGPPGLLPSFDLTAGDRGMKVSEDDYGMKVPITAAQKARPRRPATPSGQAAGPGGTHPSPSRNDPPQFRVNRQQWHSPWR